MKSEIKINYFCCFIFKLNIELLRQNEGGKYEEMFKSDPFDLCLFTSGREVKLNRLIKAAFQTMKKTFPNFFRKCPYEGIVELKNWTFEKKFVTFLPSATFKIKSTYSDGENIFFVNVGDYMIT
jgi:hypothetical protein